MNSPKQILILSHAIKEAGGTLRIVGGSVRDSLMGIKPQDWDIEVYGLEASHLEKVLKRIGHAKWVGKSFGIFKTTIQGMNLDVAIPTIDGKLAPFISLEDAAKRRDLTINAITYNPITMNYADPYGGKEDIVDERLAAVDPKTFQKDPLRVIRVARFSAQFRFIPTSELTDICRKLSLKEIAIERVEHELRLLWLKGEKPSVGLLFLKEIDAFSSLFPLWKGFGEKDMIARVDRGSSLRIGKENIDAALLWSCAWASLPLDSIESLLNQLKIHKLGGLDLRRSILDGVKYAEQLRQAETISELMHLSDKIEIDYLLRVTESIYGESLGAQRRIALQHGILRSAPPHLVRGQDLYDNGYRGKEIGKMMATIRTLQLDGQLTSKTDALEHIKGQKR